LSEITVDLHEIFEQMADEHRLAFDRARLAALEVKYLARIANCTCDAAAEESPAE